MVSHSRLHVGLLRRALTGSGRLQTIRPEPVGGLKCGHMQPWWGQARLLEQVLRVRGRPM